MPRIQIEMHVIREYYNRWKIALKREERSAVINDFMKLSGLSKNTIYARFGELGKGVNVMQVSGLDVPKVYRKSEYDRAQLKQDIITIVKAKWGSNMERKGYGMSWSKAIHVCEMAGHIPKGKYNRHLVERWASEFGLSNAWRNYDGPATQLVAEYRNQVWFVDASPANQYYFNFTNNQILWKPDLKFDSHLVENLEKHGLRKVWVYYIRDLFSGAYLLYPFAPDPRTPGSIKGGENSIDWLTHLRWSMTRKSDLRIPIHGRPEIIIADKNSYIKSDLFQGFFARLVTPGELPTEIRTHKARRPEAGGFIEGQIGAVKRSYEVILDRDKIESMQELVHFMHEWMIYDNNERGYFRRWINDTHPIAKVTTQSIEHALQTDNIRVVDAYHCVSINSQTYFIKPNINGTVKRSDRVTVFTDQHGKKVAQDESGQLYEMTLAGRLRRNAVSYQILDERGEYIVKSKSDHLRDAIRKDAPKFKRTLKRENYLPDNSHSIYFTPAIGEEIETHATLPSRLTDKSKVWAYIKNETGLDRCDLDKDDADTLDEAMNSMLETNGFYLIV